MGCWLTLGRIEILPLFAPLAGVLFFAVLGCGDDDGAGGSEESAEVSQDPGVVTDGTAELPETDEAEQQHAEMLDREFPLHGLVTGLQLRVRKDPNPEGEVIGWLRIGNRVRAKESSTRTATCASGWHELYPRGYACAGEGIELGDEPPDSELAVAPPSREDTLPYSYWYVKEPMVPEYHRAPSRNEQRAAKVFADRYLELLADNEARAERFLEGGMANEPQKPAVVHRYLNRGFFVAGIGVEVRAQRNFVRTVRGRYVKQARLESRSGHDFVGVEITEENPLPLVWTVRAAHPRIRREQEDGTNRWIRDPDREAYERQTLLDNWQGVERQGPDIMHILDMEGDRRHLHPMYLAVAFPIDRPRGVSEEEPWIHINLDQQTAVLYEGDTPVFATLVSTGAEGHETPTGVFQLHQKYVADTMANIGGGLDDRYSIEDVPWTQYFDGSFALHAAFWHTRFGMTKSHGCVNLTPADAQRVFRSLWPRVPDGWLGVTAGETGEFRSSHVVVTDDTDLLRLSR